MITITGVPSWSKAATLHLARDHGFARRRVNSGRLSVPATLHTSPLNTPDRDTFAGAMRPGAAAVDAPMAGTEGAAAPAWLLRQLDGQSFAALVFDGPGTVAALHAIQAGSEGLVCVRSLVLPTEGLAAERYDAQPGTVYLLRPDQHVCARWRGVKAGDVAAALRRALALPPA